MSINKYLSRDLRSSDFSNQVLVGANFDGLDCSGCNFSNSDLSFATFKNANLYRANFTGAILYVTYFDSCDLTRAIFRKSYPYGIKFIGEVNVTYADFTNFQVENKRRHNGYELPDSHFQDVTFGSIINYSKSKIDFKVNEKKIAFEDFQPFEKEMQKYQIYNRLKRVFTENGFMEEAGAYHYYERYWLTRSQYRHLPLSSTSPFSNLIKRGLRTVGSLISELVCGYGERPSNALYILLSSVVIFAGLYLLIPILWKGSYASLNGYDILSSQRIVDNILHSIYYSFDSFIPFLGNAQAHGLVIPLSITESIISLTLVTVLITSLIRKMIRE